MEEDFKIADLEIDIPTHMSNWMVADLVDEDGNWQINELQQWLPSDMIAKIVDVIKTRLWLLSDIITFLNFSISATVVSNVLLLRR